MNKGYHYTSFDNWTNIEQNGLIPYTISKQELLYYVDNYPVNGIWIWLHKMIYKSHVGSILWQVITKSSTKVVLLEVNYNKEDVLLGNDGDRLVLCHIGNIENWHYHNGKESETAIIVTKPIPPENIKLLKIYDLIKLLS